MGRVVTVAGREAGHRHSSLGKAFQAEGTIGAETLRENALKQNEPVGLGQNEWGEGRRRGGQRKQEAEHARWRDGRKAQEGFKQGCVTDRMQDHHAPLETGR